MIPSVEIDNVKIEGITRVTFRRSMLEIVDRCSFEFPYEVNNALITKIVQPLNLSNVRLFFGAQLVFTGVVVIATPQVTSTSSTIALEAASLPYILGESTLPPSSYPLEWSKQTLSQVVGYIASAFDISFTDNFKDTYVFKKIECKPTQRMFDFLKPLCRKRSVLLGNDEKGGLIMEKINNGVPIAHLREGTDQIVDINSKINVTPLYTNYTGILKGGVNTKASTITVKNPIIKTTSKKHMTHSFANIDSTGLQDALKAKIRRDLALAYTCTITLVDWYYAPNKLYDCNKILNVYAPKHFINRAVNFLVESIDFEYSSGKQQAVLSLVLPQSLDPTSSLEKMPWEN